jgi:transcriptional regulator with XRE-family HTH domain
MTGEQLRKRRQKIGLTQAKLAKLLDVAENAVYRWENDVVPISRMVELAFERIEEKIKLQIDNL